MVFEPIDVKDIPISGKAVKSKGAGWAESTVKEFLESGHDAVQILEGIEGKITSLKDLNKATASLRGYISRTKSPAKVITRKLNVYLVKEGIVCP